MYDIKKFKKIDFGIKSSGSPGFYIWAYQPNKRKSGIFKNVCYMHRDGTVHDICGSKNFYTTIEEAESIIINAFKKEYITDKDLEIEI